ncbi:MAG: hypothetical protein WCR72_14645 [Bacteroidota bacterium]
MLHTYQNLTGAIDKYVKLSNRKGLLKEKEDTRLEFTKAAFALPNKFFGSICATLNFDAEAVNLGSVD